MKHVVGVAEMKISNDPDDLFITHALGSCLGVSVYDPEAGVGGVLHVMLPTSSVSPDKAIKNPYMFVDTGTPLFFRELYSRGAKKAHLVVKVAGGASVGRNKSDFFAIGKRNYTMLRKLFWKNQIPIKSQDVGGNIARTLYLDNQTGKTWLQSRGREWDL
ncbi:MAG: chemotaxis protein CheD [Planctomycetota bacterium]